MRKLRIGVVFGGRSGEHEVSLASAASVLGAIDRDRYEVVPMGIAKDGHWLVGGDPLRALAEASGVQLALPPAATPAVPAEAGLARVATSGGLPAGTAGRLDVVFPILHGPYGEDGTVQGLLELADVPYVGAGVLASAVGMDKATMKAVFQAHGLPIVPHQVVFRHEWATDPDAIARRVTAELGYPCFVKPSNLGSSVGISKVRAAGDLAAAVAAALGHDRKVLIERGVTAREIEVSVLGNDRPEASVPGEVLPGKEWYDYEAKYTDGIAKLLIPAPVPAELAAEFRRLAVRAFQAIDAAGLARVDFFLEDDERIWVNEINTIPGFTRFSAYPRLWEASGLPYARLIDRLIELAVERHARRAPGGREPPARRPGRRRHRRAHLGRAGDRGRAPRAARRRGGPRVDREPRRARGDARAGGRHRLSRDRHRQAPPELRPPQRDRPHPAGPGRPRRRRGGFSAASAPTWWSPPAASWPSPRRWRPRRAAGPLLVHEQVVVPGLANRLIARVAGRVAVSFAAAAAAFPPGKVVVTGNPVRPELLAGDRARGAAGFGLDPGVPLVYVTGGALGSHRINRVVGEALPRLLAAAQCVHQCGENPHDDAGWLAGQAAALPEALRARYRVLPFVSEGLADLYAAAALVVGRAGGGTVTELAALGLPSVLIPLPGARGDEQTANARVLADAGAAVLLPERELTADRLVGLLGELLGDPARLRQMAERARGLARPDAAERLVDLVLELAGRR